MLSDVVAVSSFGCLLLVAVHIEWRRLCIAFLKVYSITDIQNSVFEARHLQDRWNVVVVEVGIEVRAVLPFVTIIAVGDDVLKRGNVHVVLEILLG